MIACGPVQRTARRSLVYPLQRRRSSFVSVKTRSTWPLSRKRLVTQDQSWPIKLVTSHAVRRVVCQSAGEMQAVLAGNMIQC